MIINFFKAGVGGAGAQVINLLALPVIARLYAPEVYASWAIVVATSAIVGSVSCFRYELAIVIPKNENEASSIFWLCILFSLGIGLLFAVAIRIPWLYQIVQSYQVESMWVYTLFIPVLITSMGISFALKYWYVRQRTFLINSISQMILALVTLLIQFLYAVKLSASSTGLLVGSLAGQQALILTCLVGFKYTTPPKLSKAIIKNIPEHVVKYYRFLFYSTPYMLFGMFRVRASLLVLTYFLTSRDVGLYAFAYRIMNFPVSLISGALRPVLFKETAEHGVKSLEQKINNILMTLAVVSTPLVVCYFFYAEDLFRLIFGEVWAGAGTIGKFIVLPVFTLLFCNWMDRLMDVLGQQRLVLFLEISFSSASIMALWLGFVFGNGLFSALLFQCIILIAYNVCYLLTAYGTAGYKKKNIAYLLVTVAVLALFTTSVLYLV